MQHVWQFGRIKMQKEKITAIVLAGGSGKRMRAGCKKQYMELGGKPILFYSLKAFEESEVDDIILVTNEAEYCKKNILQKYGLNKVSRIVPGGAERYHSVYNGLISVTGSSYVLIHDGARPCLTQEIIKAAVESVKQYHACVIGMPVKDTIKIADSGNFAANTPDRERVWQIQTPQAFSYPMIRSEERRVGKEC